jgi:predicted Na+-dependent transporter
VTAAFTAAARTIDAHFLPFCLTTGVALGVLNPGPGVAAAALNLNSAITFTMFVIAGLQLRQGEAAKALRAKGALAYGLTSILLLTPLAAIPVLALPLEPRELALGLAVFCCMPTALSSGITFTTAVGGNVAVALLLTVLSNLAGVFTMPLLLPALLGPAIGGAVLERGPLLARLVSCVLVPTLVGAAARAFVPGTAALIDANKPALARLSAVLLALVPWTQVSKTVSQGVALPLGPLLLAAAAGVAVHLAFLTLNISACRCAACVCVFWIRGKRGSACAVWLAFFSVLRLCAGAAATTLQVSHPEPQQTLPPLTPPKQKTKTACCAWARRRGRPASATCSAPSSSPRRSKRCPSPSPSSRPWRPCSAPNWASRSCRPCRRI